MKITRNQLQGLIIKTLQETFWGPGISSPATGLMGPKFKEGENVVMHLQGSPPFKGIIHSSREGPRGIAGPAYTYDIEVSPDTYGTVSLPGFGPEIVQDVSEYLIDFSQGGNI
tara:strand:+ start:97 stop:435 length:339 start_codon:yes stop_codon:yes gene_type:complete